MKHIHTFENFLNENLNEGATSANELASFLDKNQGHFAAFLKPKKYSVNVSGKVVTVRSASGSFTITIDFAKSTIDSTGKPKHPESVSYLEMMEYIKNNTKFTVLNESSINEAVGKHDYYALWNKHIMQIIKDLDFPASYKVIDWPDLPKKYQEDAIKYIDKTPELQRI